MASVFQPKSVEEIMEDKKTGIQKIIAGELKRQKLFWKYLDRIGDNSSRSRNATDLLYPKEYLRANFGGRAQKMDLEIVLRLPTLYYPGAGEDFGPFKLFSRYSAISTVIYCDYQYGSFINTAGEAGIREELNEYKVVSEGGLSPTSFGQKSWEEFWPAVPNSRGFASPRGAFGAWALLCLCPKETGVIKMINFIYLCTEATQTYDILFVKRKIKPMAVVIQDHGLGGGWTVFGGKSKLYDIARSALPPLLYLSDNTNVWPGYKRVSDCGEPEGMHGNKRALYSLNSKTNKKKESVRSLR